MAYYALKYVVLLDKEVRMIEGYSTVKSIAEKWRLTERTVQIMCAEGKIKGATKFGGVWAIPSDAKKPTDNRVISGEYKNWRRTKHEETAL